MKRFYVFAAIIMLLVACSWANVCVGAANQPDHITLTWTGNPATTMTITWRTDVAVTTGFVQYQNVTAHTSCAKRANATASNFSTDLGTNKLFSTTLTDLSPNTSYSYRVGDGTHWSGMKVFSTASTEIHDFKFLIFGDSQSPAGPYNVWRETVHNAYKANPDARFFVNVGDLVDCGQSMAHWDGWFAASAGVIDTIPAMPVVGNHETYGSSDTARPTYWNAQFHLPQNGPASLKNQAYSYNYGPVHFVVLDSQQDEERRYGDILTLQKKWLDADLSSSKAPWKIVFFHKAPYSIKDGRDNKAVKDAFCPLFDKYHVNVVFNGHDHGVSRTYPMKNGSIVKQPSQGTIYYVAGRSGTKFYTDVRKRYFDEFFYKPQDQPNYLVVQVSNKKLTVRTVKQDGSLVDTFSIDK